MVAKHVDRVFLLFSAMAILFIIFMFHSWNKIIPVNLPETAGQLTKWGVDSCDIKDNYVHISAWSSPDGVLLFENSLYVKTLSGDKYIKLSSQTYNRHQESEEMKAHGYFDNSGIVAAIRIAPWMASTDKKIVMISKAKDGKLYRGDYDCK